MCCELNLSVGECRAWVYEKPTPSKYWHSERDPFMAAWCSCKENRYKSVIGKLQKFASVKEDVAPKVTPKDTKRQVSVLETQAESSAGSDAVAMAAPLWASPSFQGNASATWQRQVGSHAPDRLGEVAPGPQGRP
jgi:hypothetical protein